MSEKVMVNPNLQELIAALNKLPEDMRLEAIDVLKRSAETIAAYAQIIVHVDKGNLRDSIHVEQTDPYTVTVAAGGPTAPYAAIIEAKYPYMKPAFDLIQPQIAEQLKELVQVKINSVASGK